MSATQVANETTFLTIAGRKTQLLRGGSGPPLVYLHSAAGETEWTPFHNLLAERFTVYAPAAPGFALSEGLDDIDSMNDLVWHTIDLLAELKLSNVPVIGYSLGAWLGVELAILRPELVSRLVMIAAAGLHVDGAPMGELFIDDFQKLNKLLLFDPTGPAVQEALPQSLDDPRILLWLRAREATARIGWNPYLHNPKLPGHLHRVQCPTLLVWGRHDKLIPLAHGEYYAQHIAGAKLEVIEECGHMPLWEQTAATAAKCLAFVTK